MAVANTDVSFQRFDGKLDSILRKNLPLELYERLCVTESCIVVTHGRKKSQRLVILGDTAMYFAEVPPKTVKRALELSQVVSSRIINDVPNFLSDSEKDNVLHIQLFYTIISSHDTNERSRSTSPHPKLSSPAAMPTTPAKNSRVSIIKKEDHRLLTGSVDSLRSSTLSLPPVQSIGDDTVNTNDTEKITRVVSLDLYVLQGRKGGSRFYHHLQVLLEDVAMRSLCSNCTKMTARESQQASLVSNFQSLKAELLLTVDYEKSAGLLLELKQGAEKYYVLKKLYWQDLELTGYCISQLTQTTASIANQFDQIEYCVIACELLSTMLSETHTVTGRTDLLFHESGSFAVELVTTLIDLFEKFTHHKETSLLLKELAGILAGIFYELFRLAQQVTWFVPKEVSAITSTSLSDLVSMHKSAVLFLSRVVDSLSDNDTCNQQSTPLLTLYRKVSFIDKVTQHSERSLALFRKHFREEFQYMIPGNHSEKVISDKLTCIRTKIIQH